MSTYTPDNLLIASGMPLTIQGGVIASGAGALSRGTVLGKLTTGGKYKIVDSTSADGTEEPYAILAEDVDATSADVKAPVYLTGMFNEDALTFGGTDTADTHRVACRKIGLFLGELG